MGLDDVCFCYRRALVHKSFQCDFDSTQQDHASAVCKETCDQCGIEAVHPAGKFTEHKSACIYAVSVIPS